jgi:hypothetical protein
MITETSSVDWRERIYECIHCGKKLEGTKLDPWKSKDDKPCG